MHETAFLASIALLRCTTAAQNWAKWQKLAKN